MILSAVTPGLSAWPAIFTAAALGLLLVLVIRFKMQAFVALLLASLALGLSAGLTPEELLLGRKVEENGKMVEKPGAISKGVGDILRDVAVILALGAMLGRMLDVSGAAEVIARTLVNAFGVTRSSFAVLVAGYLIGIPVLFNVGFLLLIPIMWRLQRDTGKSLLYYVLPLSFSLGIAHSLIPPHPGIVGAVSALGGDRRNQVMIETIVFGTLMGIPLVLFGWFGPGRFWARRQMVEVPEHLAGKVEAAPAAGDKAFQKPPSFALSVLIVTLPLLQSLLGFGVQLLGDLNQLPAWATQPLAERADLPVWLAILSYSPVDWLRLLGHPTMALLVPTGLAYVLLGLRRGMSGTQLSKLATEALRDVGEMAFLFAAAGGFKEVIQVTRAGDYIASAILELRLSPVLAAYLVAVLMRVALGSATAAVLTASALLVGLSQSLPGQETLLVLAVANGVTFMTQPADSGFWLVKEYCNLSVRDVLIRFNACRIPMSLLGIGMLLAYEAWVL